MYKTIRQQVHNVTQSLPSCHQVVSVNWNVWNEYVVVFVVTIWSTEPFVEAMLEWQIVRLVTEMPVKY